MFLALQKLHFTVRKNYYKLSKETKTHCLKITLQSQRTMFTMHLIWE